MKKTKIYFAHPVCTYDTIIENFFLEQFSGFSDIEIVNPNKPEHKKGYKREGMEYFKKLVQECDKLYAFSFGDNTIGSGVAKEMDWMFEKGGSVIFLPFFSKYEEQVIEKCGEQFKVLSVQETRLKLKSYDDGLIRVNIHNATLISLAIIVLAGLIIPVTIFILLHFKLN